MAKKFQHSASAYGIGGRFLWPVQETIAVRPSVDLPPTGGFGRDLQENFNLHEQLSYRKAYTEVSGSPNEELVDGRKVPAQNNLSLSVIEDFNLLHVLEVRKIVSRITTRYFEGADDIEIVLSGTRFEGFRIFGHDVIVKLATDLFLENSTHPRLKTNYQGDSATRERFHLLSDGEAFSPENIQEHRITIVEKIIVPHPTSEFRVERNVIDIPHVGRLFLGELTFSPTSKSLSMMRWELGCPSGGDGAGGGGEGGGGVIP